MIITFWADFEVGFEIFVEDDLIALKAFDPEVPWNFEAFFPVPLSLRGLAPFAKPFRQTNDLLTPYSILEMYLGELLSIRGWCGIITCRAELKVSEEESEDVFAE